jgi:hypothetical protein
VPKNVTLRDNETPEEACFYYITPRFLCLSADPRVEPRTRDLSEPRLSDLTEWRLSRLTELSFASPDSDWDALETASSSLFYLQGFKSTGLI